jgi:hypothetical protein
MKGPIADGRVRVFSCLRRSERRRTRPSSSRRFAPGPSIAAAFGIIRGIILLPRSRERDKGISVSLADA